jgi:hypothetical protein
MITNPTPITPQTFAGMWITNLGIFLPTVEKPKGFIGGNLLPYDGTHLLATGGRRLFVGDLAAKRTQDAQLDSMLTALEVEVQRQAGKTVAVKFISTTAPDPAKPVVAQVAFADGSFHRIPDCFALCGTDQTFAGVFLSAMAEIARQAGLSVQ